MFCCFLLWQLELVDTHVNVVIFRVSPKAVGTQLVTFGHTLAFLLES
jgi:hypothetical protein